GGGAGEGGAAPRPGGGRGPPRHAWRNQRARDRRRLVRRLLLPLLCLAVLAACGHAEVPPPRPLATSTAATPELKEGAGRGQAPLSDADAQAAIARGIAQGQGGDVDGARKTFQDVVSRNPNAGPAWVNLGVLAERPGDVKEAESSYRRAAQCTPDPPESWDFLARLLVRTKRAGEAEALLRGRIQQAPDSLGARNALTWVLLETGRLPEAEAESKKILKADEQNVRAMQLLAPRYYPPAHY